MNIHICRCWKNKPSIDVQRLRGTALCLRCSIKWAQIYIAEIMCLGHDIVHFQVSNFDSSSEKCLVDHGILWRLHIIRGWINFNRVMASPTGGDPSSWLDDHKIQVEEDIWWHVPSLRYCKHSDLPPSSKWTARAIPETSNMTLAVGENTLTFPRPWISICFLLDLQQLTSLACAISSATLNPAFSDRLYSNVCFIDHLRAHVIRHRLQISRTEVDSSWIPLALERWMLRHFCGLTNEKGAYMALEPKFSQVYWGDIQIWDLGNNTYAFMKQVIDLLAYHIFHIMDQSSDRLYCKGDDRCLLHCTQWRNDFTASSRVSTKMGRYPTQAAGIGWVWDWSIHCHNTERWCSGGIQHMYVSLHLNWKYTQLHITMYSSSKCRCYQSVVSIIIVMFMKLTFKQPSRRTRGEDPESRDQIQ